MTHELSNHLSPHYFKFAKNAESRAVEMYYKEKPEEGNLLLVIIVLQCANLFSMDTQRYNTFIIYPCRYSWKVYSKVFVPILLTQTRLPAPQPDLSDISKINKILEKFRASGAPKFDTYERVPFSYPPADYLKFLQFSKDLEVPAVDLYVYQHVIKDVYVSSSNQLSSASPASEVRFNSRSKRFEREIIHLCFYSLVSFNLIFAVSHLACSIY